MSFDFFLKKGNYTKQVLTDELKVVASSIFETDSWVPHEGFQGFNLSEENAKSLVEVFLRNREYALVVSSSYRNPKISAKEGQSIAEVAIRMELQHPDLRNIKFEEIRFIKEEPMWWEFGAPSEELQRKGFVPGGIIVHIDKLDGHIWTDRERIQINYEEYYLDSASTMSSDSLINLWKETFDFYDAVDYFDGNSKCIRKGDLMISSNHYSYSGLPKGRVEFVPKLFFRLRLLRSHQKGGANKRLMFSIIENLLKADLADMRLTSYRGNLITIFERIHGQLTVNNLGEDWISIKPLFLSQPHEMR